MKTTLLLLLAIGFTLNLSAQTAKTPPARNITHSKLPLHKNLPHRGRGTPLVLAYDNFDFINFGQSSYQDFLWLMNSGYTIGDTAGSPSSLMKYAVVAYDTILDYNNNIPYNPQDYNELTVDTISFTAGWENNSQTDDTIELSIIEVNAGGYPSNVKMWDTLMIYSLGSTIDNQWTSTTAVTIAPEFTLPAGQKHFAVKLEFHGSKLDTFAFSAGYPFDPNSVCTAQGAGKSTYYPNSFAYWLGSQALLPTSTGGDIYYDCNNDGQLDVGDGASYIQNIGMGVIITLDSVYSCSLTATENHTNTQCGKNNGSANITVGGAVSSVSYSWSNGATTQNLDSIGQGIYTVTVSDSSCSKIVNVIIGNSDGPAISATHTDITCTNINGSINTTITGGTLPYIYKWSNGATIANLDSLLDASYYLTVTDANNCAAYAIVPVKYNVSNLFYIYVAATPENCNQHNGNLIAYPNRGIPPFSYEWSNGASTAGVNGVSSGNYTVSVTDSSGCQAVGAGIVESQCFNIIKGKVFTDANGNCVYDTGDSLLTFVSVYAVALNGDYYFGYTNPDGTYSIEVDGNGTYTLGTGLSWSNSCVNVRLCGNPLGTITFNSVGDSSVNNDFSATLSPLSYDLSIHPGWTSANPGFEKDYWVYYYNQSAVPFNGSAIVTFNYDPNLIYESSSAPLPLVVDTVAHKLVWNVNDVGYWSGNGLFSNFRVKASTPLSYNLQSDFTITPTSGDCDTTNNHFHYSEPVTGSHDPNEKDVTPEGSIAYEDSVLTYTIHFQNTGSDTTNFVIVKDTLSPYVDASTVRNLASSHKYTEFGISGKGILKWVFSPIYLVDSATNASKSKGFVTFSVKKKKGTPGATVIKNKSSIYFDYNEPVVTNTVTSFVNFPTAIKNTSSFNSPFAIFPNPTDGDVTVASYGAETIKEITITNTLGQLVSTISISTGNDKSINVHLPAVGGMYFIHLKGEKGEYVSKVVRD